MGQSMESPKRASTRNFPSRYSTRSLQKSSRKSLVLEKRNSLSASKIQQNNNNQANQGQLIAQNTQIRNGELFIMSRHEEPQVNIREANQMNAQNMNFKEEGDLNSPIFKSVQQSGGDYGLVQWGNNQNSKEVSHNETHNHEITISFSKAKNHINNCFHDEPQQRKSKLKKILEYGDEQQDNLHGKKSEVKKKNQYLDQQIDNILTLKSVCSDSYKTPNQSEQTPSKKRQIETARTQQNSKISKKLQKVIDSKLKPKKVSEKHKKSIVVEEQKVEEKLTPCFNDYDTQFANKEKEIENSKNGYKLSKKMQELKEKIANRAISGKGKDALNKYSLQNLSVSFRHVRNSCSLDKSNQSRSSSKLKNAKDKLWKTYLTLDQSKQSLDLNGGKQKKLKEVEKKMKKKQESKVEEKRNQQQLKIKKQINPEKLQKVKSKQDLKKKKSIEIESVKKNEKPSQNQIINHLYQAAEKDKAKQKESEVKQEKVKQKKSTFIDLVKRDHHGHLKKNKGSYPEDEIKFSELIENKDKNINKPQESKLGLINRSISLQEYQFGNSPPCSMNDKDKFSKKKMKQINNLKKIAEQLNKRQAKVKNSQFSFFGQPSQNSSTKEPSLRNKSCSYQRHPVNMTSINYKQVMNNFEQYMLNEAVGKSKDRGSLIKAEKRKVKSLQKFKTVGIKSKLIIF